MQVPGAYDPGTTAHFKSVLLALRVSVKGRIERNGSPISVEEVGGVDKEDRPQLIASHEALTVVGDQERLRDIEAALSRIEQGTFGRCVDCEAPILLARLEAIPTASRCVPCHAEHKSRALPRRMGFPRRASVPA